MKETLLVRVCRLMTLADDYFVEIIMSALPENAWRRESLITSSQQCAWLTPLARPIFLRTRRHFSGYNNHLRQLSMPPANRCYHRHFSFIYASRQLSPSTLPPPRTRYHSVVPAIICMAGTIRHHAALTAAIIGSFTDMLHGDEKQPVISHDAAREKFTNDCMSRTRRFVFAHMKSCRPWRHASIDARRFVSVVRRQMGRRRHSHRQCAPWCFIAL